MANDYEQAIIDLLSQQVTAPVSSLPSDALPCIRVRRVGGAATSRVREEVHIAVESYGDTETAAQELLELARGYLLEKASSVARTRFIRGVSELAAPTLLPDPSRPEADRYSMTIAIVARRKLVF